MVFISAFAFRKLTPATPAYAAPVGFGTLCLQSYVAIIVFATCSSLFSQSRYCCSHRLTQVLPPVKSKICAFTSLRYVHNGGIVVLPCLSCSRKPTPATPATQLLWVSALCACNPTSLLLCSQPVRLCFHKADTVAHTGLRKFFRLSNQRFVRSLHFVTFTTAVS